MKTDDMQPAGGTCGKETLRLLKLLARTGALVEAGDGLSQVAEFTVFREFEGRVARLGTVAKSAVEQAAARGWIERRGSAPRHWRLTGVGRLHLRRVLSEGQDVLDGTALSAPKGEAEATIPETNLSESPLAWLRRRKDKDGRPMINAAQFEAGERLRADFRFAQMTPRVTTNWQAGIVGRQSTKTAPGHKLDFSDNVVAARQRVRRALASVGPELAGILIDVCCHLKGLEDAERTAGWPQRSAKIVLQLALNGLARHYGLLGTSGPQTTGPGNSVQHWGTPDYRPTAEQWK